MSKWRQNIRRNTRNSESNTLREICPYCGTEIDKIEAEYERLEKTWYYHKILDNGELLFYDYVDSDQIDERLIRYLCPECEHELTKEEIEQIFNVRIREY